MAEFKKIDENTLEVTEIKQIDKGLLLDQKQSLEDEIAIFQKLIDEIDIKLNVLK